VVALSGSLERFTNGDIVLKHPTVQFFEKKIKPEAPTDTPAGESKAPTASGPAAKTAEGPGSAPKDAPTPSPTYPTLTLNRRGAAKT
jgi:hypothetical protein